MKQELISLNSDTINKYGYRFLTSSLEDAIKDNFEKGIPMCIGHDRHRPIGVTFPFALYMEPHISRLLGKRIIPVNSNEQEEINKLHSYYIQKKYQEEFTPHQDKFLELVRAYISDKHMRIAAGCVAVFEKGVALKVFPKLFQNKDDAGLIPLSNILSDFIYQGQGIFKHRISDLSVFADKNFRRSQSVHNNFHFYFLDELLRLSNQEDLSIKLCIDEDLIGYAPSYNDSMELEYHWGPKFNDDISAIKSGLTKHECDEFDRAFYSLSRTEFYWKSDEDEKTFELEELRDQPAPGNNQEIYNNRYVHSIYNTNTKAFFHFDGAIRSYDMEEMVERLDKTFLEYGRKAQYKKLFRIDGKLSLEKWKLLTIHYMQGNPLIYEYFGVGEEREMQRLQPKELEEDKKILPFQIAKESGIRLLISYHNIPDNLKEGRYIDIYDVMSTDNEKFDCVEHTIYEVKKSLQRLNADLQIADDAILFKIDDRYVNIPSIMHNGTDAVQSLKVTIQAYKNLFASMNEKGFDKDIAFTLGITVNNRVLRMSAYGNIAALLNWMNENLPFPDNEKEFSNWINKQRKYLESFPESSDDPLITSLVQFDGVLYIKRPHVKFPYKLEEDETGIKFKITFPKEDDEILKLIKAEKVQPKMLVRVHEMVWSDTTENYFTSLRSKWLDAEDENVAVNVLKWEPMNLYWSKL